MISRLFRNLWFMGFWFVRKWIMNRDEKMFTYRFVIMESLRKMVEDAIRRRLMKKKEVNFNVPREEGFMFYERVPNFSLKTTVSRIFRFLRSIK